MAVKRHVYLYVNWKKVQFKEVALFASMTKMKIFKKLITYGDLAFKVLNIVQNYLYKQIICFLDCCAFKDL